MSNKFKDFLYDKSDILVAMAILLLAALLIFWRANVIVDYPQKLVKTEYSPNQGYEPITTPYNDVAPLDDDDPYAGLMDINRDGVIDELDLIGSDPNATGSAVTGETEEPTVYSVYVNSGQSISSIGEVLVGLGLYDSIEEFNQYVSAAGADTSIQMGNHIFPASATKEEIIQYLCEVGAGM